ncbi:hypothetical protein P4V86_12165 [Brevibacillus laterosporus]|uniref:HipA family kinase n=1 Tax=Brevibacillus laterosporus TaxID=1465 RepID=UPI000381DF73|nr:HipA family kinase [Brevibacillus laterosporus]ATO51246.1 hypothetical protein BrL25_20375 [Brevibacillus laterosporus DSM 25]MBG9804182.1 hypothetical protein [Brevibacillus laterosporus]MED2004106.1 hypothetical protein [Brevibacillus laterosporus]MED4763323.1 hypothetical protein [Brevibacillus laterosporus]TPH14791.1 hypothetical protein EGH09_12915 [Brevibacillus laterosporus]
MSQLRFHRQLEGKSLAHLITGEDGQKYVVKAVTPGFDKTLLNEWIGYCFARFLQLPIPRSSIIHLPQPFYEQQASLDPLLYTPEQFASSYIPNAVNVMHQPLPEKLSNPEVIAPLIVFDYWLCNVDRTKKNVLLTDEADGFARLWFIDQAEILGSPNWNTNTLQRLPIRLLKSSIHMMLAKHVSNEREFWDALEIVHSIPSMLIEEVVHTLPASWPVTDAEKKELVNTLVKRKQKHLQTLMRLFYHEIYLPSKNQL